MGFCNHEMGTMATRHGDYCTGCGTLMTGPVPLAPLDTSKLGPIKLNYDRAMQDSRALHWRRIPLSGPMPMPVDKPFYIAWPTAPDHWSVVRITPGQTVPRQSTHWCPDLLGVPACSD